jgi:hypothetical protein
MKTYSKYKPVGGVESCALYPADAVITALFSSEGCEVELSGTPIEVPLLEGASQYEESISTERGAVCISHQLHLLAERNDAAEWLDNALLERASFDGLIAVISLCDGRRLLAGYSAQFGNENPLRLTALSSTSGNSLHETPSVALHLVSCDTEFSAPIF